MLHTDWLIGWQRRENTSRHHTVALSSVTSTPVFSPSRSTHDSLLCIGTCGMRNGTPVNTCTSVADNQERNNKKGTEEGDIKDGTIWYLCESYN